MRRATEMKQRDRVIYSIGGVEYPALVTREAKLGFHPGAKQASVHVNLVYLNESAQAVKVFDAPLLLAAASVEDLAAIAEIEKQADDRRTRKAHLHRSTSAIVSAMLSANQAFGWRPDTTADELAALKAQIAAQSTGEQVGKALSPILQSLTETTNVEIREYEEAKGRSEAMLRGETACLGGSSPGPCGAAGSPAGATVAEAADATGSADPATAVVGSDVQPESPSPAEPEAPADPEQATDAVADSEPVGYDASAAETTATVEEPSETDASASAAAE
jgi:hypothetical protein